MLCLILPLAKVCRRHLNIRGKSANLPAITDKDWLDLKFGIDVGVDYYALSFVRSADVIYELKDYLAKQGANWVYFVCQHCISDLRRDRTCMLGQGCRLKVTLGCGDADADHDAVLNSC